MPAGAEVAVAAGTEMPADVGEIDVAEAAVAASVAVGGPEAAVEMVFLDLG